MKFLISFLLALLTSCSASKKIKPVTNFDLTRYYGTWYEITKLDYSFERECAKARFIYLPPAHHSGMDITNECLDEEENIIKDAFAKAHVKKNNVAEFSVYLYSIIQLEYRVVYIDEKYEYAIIDGGNFDYYWIISKLKNPDMLKIESLISKAKMLGFDTANIIVNKFNNSNPI
jgi:apolipoprotein D and lipocalin family protein